MADNCILVYRYGTAHQKFWSGSRWSSEYPDAEHYTPSKAFREIKARAWRDDVVAVCDYGKDYEVILPERTQENPTATQAVNKPSDTELVVGGIAAVSLVALGIYVIYQALNQTPDTTSTLEDTSSLAALGVLV